MSNETLQGMIDLGLSITVYCENGHHKRLDLVALRDRFGPDAGALAKDIMPKMGSCSVCGAPAESMIVSPGVTAAGSPVIAR